MREYAVRLRDYTKCSMMELQIGDVYSYFLDNILVTEGLIVVGNPDVIVKNLLTVIPSEKI